jgi:peroxiredoxin
MQMTTGSIRGGLKAGWAAALAALLVSIGLPRNLRAADSGPAPAWELKDVDGKTVKLSDYKGKVVVLDFWATWCPPCRKEIPGFVALQKQYGGQGLVVVGVSLDEDGPAVVKKFMKANAVNYPVVMGTEAVTAAYGGVSSIPTTFVIGRDGTIVSKHVGFAPQSKFEQEILPLLKAKP